MFCLVSKITSNIIFQNNIDFLYYIYPYLYIALLPSKFFLVFFQLLLSK